MTRSQVETVVKGIRYRSWRFSIDDSGDVRVRARVQDAYSRKRRSVTVYGYVIGPERCCFTEDELLKEIYDAISSILHHEASEWFKYKGKRPFDPHQ